MSTMQPIRSKKDIERLKEYFLNRGETRNYALVVMGINVPLRISDILKLKWENVYNFSVSDFRQHITVEEKKTGKTNKLILNDSTKEALRRLLEEEGIAEGQYIYRSYPHSTEPLNRVSAYLIIRKAAENLGLEDVGCHSLRKTFGYHAWKSGVHLALIMAIYNHSSIEVTKRYLGIEQDDKDEVIKQMCL